MSLRSVGSPMILGTISGKLANIVDVLVGVSEDTIFVCVYPGAGCTVDDDVNKHLVFYLKLY